MIPNNLSYEKIMRYLYKIVANKTKSFKYINKYKNINVNIYKYIEYMLQWLRTNVLHFGNKKHIYWNLIK